jgi:hypothetical protein
MAVSATRGFEFAYNLDGSSNPPVARDLPFAGGAAYAVGDLFYLEATNGYATVCAGTAGTFVGVLAEPTLAADAAATLRKFYILQSGQVWRVSSDAATISAVRGNRAVVNLDQNTYDADQTSGGGLTLVGTASEVDTAGKAVAYVTFTAAKLQWA